MREDPGLPAKAGGVVAPLALLLLALAGLFAQIAAAGEPGAPLALVAALRIAPQALLIMAAVGLLYHGRGCLPVAVLGLAVSILGDVGWLLVGRSAGIGVGTLIAVVLLVVLGRHWRRGRTPRQPGSA